MMRDAPYLGEVPNWAPPPVTRLVGASVQMPMYVFSPGDVRGLRTASVRHTRTRRTCVG